jgi:hypothetical protein
MPNAASILTAPIAITINSITRPSGANGPLNIVYTGPGGGGNTIGWSSPEMLDLDMSGPINVNSELGVLLFFLAWWKSRSSDYSNTALVLNKTGTMDLSAPSPWKVQ